MYIFLHQLYFKVILIVILDSHKHVRLTVNDDPEPAQARNRKNLTKRQSFDENNKDEKLSRNASFESTKSDRH